MLIIILKDDLDNWDIKLLEYININYFDCFIIKYTRFLKNERGDFSKIFIERTIHKSPRFLLRNDKTLQPPNLINNIKTL